MGWPMTYTRVIGRNHLAGDYIRETPDVFVLRNEILAAGGITQDHLDALITAAFAQARALIAGDLRRLEQDSLDEHHQVLYAAAAKITPQQAGEVLSKFFAY